MRRGRKISKAISVLSKKMSSEHMGTAKILFSQHIMLTNLCVYENHTSEIYFSFLLLFFFFVVVLCVFLAPRHRRFQCRYPHPMFSRRNNKSICMDLPLIQAIRHFHCVHMLYMEKIMDNSINRSSKTYLCSIK